MKKTLLTFAVLVAMASACKSTQDQVKSSSEPTVAQETGSDTTEAEVPVEYVSVSPEEEDSVLVSVASTPCYGTCPVINFRIYYSGRMWLDAERDYKSYSGTYEAQASDSSIAVLIRSAYNAEFYSLEDEYDAPVTDLPSRYVYFHHSGQKKEIHLRMNVPDELKEFEAEILDLIDRTDWQKTE